MSVYTGVCNYCGQVVSVPADPSGNPPPDKDAAASLRCGCDTARKIVERDRRVVEAEDHLDALFEQAPEHLTQVPPKVVDMVRSSIALVADGDLRNVSIKVNGGVSVKVAAKGDGSITVTRADGFSGGFSV